MVKSFSRSKRMPVRLRHKIEKASAAKQRKQRKEAKKNPQWKSRLKKDPGIPNLFPFKDQILAEVEGKKRLRTQENARLRDAAKGKREGINDVAAMDASTHDEILEMDESVEGMDEDYAEDSNPMAALLASARARATEYQGREGLEDMDEEEQDDEDGGIELPGDEEFSISYKNLDASRRAFDKIFKQVLEAADIILYVLDARDVEGTRSQEVERQVMAAENGSKRLILLLNKIDLVPPTVLRSWLIYLRRYFPTIPLRASTPASNAKTFEHKHLTTRGTSETLLRALKSYAACKQLKRSISVGVIGYPNVGKSSVINALTSRLNKGHQSSACPVGSEAGVTTSLREVKVDNKLKVLDSPGIVFPSTGPKPTGREGTTISDEARLILLNALPAKHISDPISAVTLLLSRLSSSSILYGRLLQTYGITALGPFGGGDTTTDFLIQVARKRGRIGRGGVPNLNAAAMAIITDWRDGRIEGWVEAPTLPVAMDETGSNVEGSVPSKTASDRKEIVKQWAAEFQIDGLWGPELQDDEVMQQ